LCLGFVLWSLLAMTLDFHGVDNDASGKSWIKRMMGVHVPYGLAIAAGAIVAFPATPWVNAG
jgi:Flp pilus assembly protein protease CpaA